MWVISNVSNCLFLEFNIIGLYPPLHSANKRLQRVKMIWNNFFVLVRNSRLMYISHLTSEASLNLISYMRTSPLGWCGSGQRRNTQSSWPSQVTWPGMSSAFSGEPQAKQVTIVITEATTLSIKFILQHLQHQRSPDTISVSAEIHSRIPDSTAQMKCYLTCTVFVNRSLL